MSTLSFRSAEMWGGIAVHPQFSWPWALQNSHHKPQLLDFLPESFKGKLTFPLGRLNMQSNLDRFHSQANIISTWLTKSATSLLMHSKGLLQNKIWVETRRKPNTFLQDSCRKENQLEAKSVSWRKKHSLNRKRNRESLSVHTKGQVHLFRNHFRS